MELTKEMIDKCFDEATHQSEYVLSLYKLVFPNWDEIEKVNGWPTIGKEANDYIWKKAMRFDSKHHPNVLNGGLWMNNGFSSIDAEKMNVGPWEVNTDQVNLTIKKEE